MNIRNKLYSLGAVPILGFAALLFSTSHFSGTKDTLNEAKYVVAKLEIRLLNLRRNEKDFLLRKDTKYLGTFNDNTKIFLDLESQLSGMLKDQELLSTSKLRADLLNYQKSFQALVNGYTEHGLSQEEKLLGEYRKQLRALEQSANAEQLVALDRFDDSIQTGVFNGDALNGMSADALKSTAQALVNKKVEIGLEYNQGLLGNTRELSHTVEEQFKTFSTVLDNHIEETQHQLNLFKNIVVGVIVLIIIGFIYQIARSINLQVSNLLTIIQSIADTNNVSMRSTLKGNDELTSIGRYFNHLLDKFEDLIRGTQQKSRDLSGSTLSMHNELQQVIEQFNVQSDHTATMATSVQEMVHTIAEISESTSVAVDGVHQASSNAKDGRSVVETTLSNIDQLSTILTNSQQSITNLNDHVDKIGDAVNIIQDIAEQTNLLALNAAIEAARAGEQGRGFAVVADEVRALASRTHKSTEDITKVVTAIQNQMQTVVSDIDKCTDQGRQTLDASHLLDSSLQQIIDDMETIQANSERIASAIEEQGIVMNQVSESITELNEISVNNMHSAQQVLTEVDSVSIQAKQMDETVAEFKTDA
ncbi:methyl-accepting chemotaxis protein [Vibrio olivae]|uniref:Methyl-accepting chemotaxis protein n=1 Tax=Vibrio olivae TaxID=1243002 RepID=A0ABV5HSP4_9VIBR